MTDNSNRSMSERIIDRFMRKAEKDHQKTHSDLTLDFNQIKKVKLE